MLAKAFGRGAHEAMKTIAEEHHGLSAHCRYLGPQLHWAGGSLPEIKARRAQAWHAFNAFGRLWRTSVSRKFKVSISTASVVSILTSAATTLVLSDNELGMLRTTQQQMVRT